MGRSLLYFATMQIFERADKRHFLILLGAFLILCLLLLSVRAPTWDEVSYYIYARSFLFDQDLHFANDFQLSYAVATPDFVAKEFDKALTDTGYVVNLFAIGNSLLWLPWLALLRLAAQTLPGLVPAETSLTGFEPIFISNLTALSALLGFGAFWLAYVLTKQVASRRIALLATLTLLVATPLLHYQFRAAMNSHAFSAFTATLVIFVWARQFRKIGTPLQAVGLGGLIGLAALVRWQNLMYLVLPLISVLWVWWKMPITQRTNKIGQALLYLALVGGAALLVFALQMAVWKVLYGSFLTIPQGSSFMDWRAPFFMPLLFSSFRGLLPWMPIFFLAVFGLLFVPRAQRPFAWPLLVVLLLELYVNASTRDWFAGAGFGPRRFTSELAILVMGYGAFLNWLPKRWQMGIGIVLAFVFGIHQWVLMRFGLVARIGGQPLSMTPTFTWQDVPLTQFMRDFAVLLQQGWQRPLDFFIMPGSPLYLLVNNQTFPSTHLLSLLITALFLLLVCGAIALLYKIKSPHIQATIFAIMGGFLIFSFWWILTAM